LKDIQIIEFRPTIHGAQKTEIINVEVKDDIKVSSSRKINLYKTTMKFPEIQTLKQIAEIIDAKYIGADDFPISGTNEIHRVKSGEIVFVNHPKYYCI